jgi:hypothetical protein
MAAAVEAKRFAPKDGGMNIQFKATGTPTIIVTFTEVVDDDVDNSYKIEFHELFNNTTHDLLCRNTDRESSQIVYDDQCIIVREDLHLTREAAKEIWDSFETGEEFMSQPQRNDDGKRFSQLTMYLKDPVIGVIHHLESIAQSLHVQKKRAAEAAQEVAKKEARAASAAESKERMEALKSTPEYKKKMEMARLKEEEEDAKAELAAAAKRAENAAVPTGPRARKPTGSSGGTRRRPSRKYKKSKRVLRRKSRSTRRR